MSLDELRVCEECPGLSAAGKERVRKRGLGSKALEFGEIGGMSDGVLDASIGGAVTGVLDPPSFVVDFADFFLCVQRH